MLTGCASGTAMRPYPPSSQMPAPSAPASNEAPPSEKAATPNPRKLAALTFLDQARLFIDQNRPDDAIRTLEQAINLYPKSGDAYYYLAEAWRLKGNFSQALEFNRIAEIYLQGSDLWAERVASQKRRINQIQE